MAGYAGGTNGGGQSGSPGGMGSPREGTLTAGVKMDASTGRLKGSLLTWRADRGRPDWREDIEHEGVMQDGTCESPRLVGNAANALATFVGVLLMSRKLFSRYGG